MAILKSRLLWLVLSVVIVGVLVLWPDTPSEDGHGPVLVEVQMPAELTSLQKQGEKAFNANCATCHGLNAAGQAGVAPPLIHRIYEPSHHGDLAIVRSVRQGVRSHHWPFGNMPPIEGVSDKEIAVIIAYIRAVQRANGIN